MILGSPFMHHTPPRCSQPAILENAAAVSKSGDEDATKNESHSRGCANQGRLRSILVSASAQMLIDHFGGRLFATATAAGDRQTALHVVQGTCTAIDSLANRAVSDGIAYADVHQVEASFSGDASYF